MTRRTLTIGLGTAAALVTAAVAFAVVPSVVGVSEATATFSTTAIDKSKVRSCTADAKTWERTDGHYRGTVASSNATLAGPLEILARTTYNTTDGRGYVSGSFRVKDGDSRLKGKFSGTIKEGKLVGYLTGTSRGNHAKVLGNLSADFAGGATNFANGQIGSGSSTNVLAVIAGPTCRDSKGEKVKDEEKKRGEKGGKVKTKRLEAEGEITALAGGPPATITVTGKRGPVTCTVDGSYAIPTGFPVGTKGVEMKCEAIGDPAVWTLRKLEKDS